MIEEMKTYVWGGLFLGSTIGGALPYLWGGSALSFSSVILSAVGGALGIWVGYQIGKGMG